jgi:hypothetical protein
MDFHHDRLTFEHIGMCQKTYARGELYRNDVCRAACELRRSTIANIWEQRERKSKWKWKGKKEKKILTEETEINESRSNRSKRNRKSRTTREKPKGSEAIKKENTSKKRHEEKQA